MAGSAKEAIKDFMKDVPVLRVAITKSPFTVRKRIFLVICLPLHFYCHGLHQVEDLEQAFSKAGEAVNEATLAATLIHCEMRYTL